MDECIESEALLQGREAETKRSRWPNNETGSAGSDVGESTIDTNNR